MAEKIFNPLDKENLGKSVSNAILSQPVIPMKELSDFLGAGIYAIYYTGDFHLYQNIALANKKEFAQPIYAGKAVPQGARKGSSLLDSLSGKDLFNRLKQHRDSILSCKNLNIEDFFCRYLIVDDIWIPLGETVLIQQTQPLWNIAIDGFGNHDPGKGRYNQKRSPWDILHPGRKWAENLAAGKSTAEIENAVKIFLQNRQ